MPQEFQVHPRNRTAHELNRIVGNPVTTLLQSGVGNCFPGLEMDMRNLERRFFPFLTVDFIPVPGDRLREGAAIVAVDIAGARASNVLTPAERAVYETLAQDTADPNKPFWFIRRIGSAFGPFGNLSLDLETVGQASRPADAWTAVRLIPEGANVTLALSLGSETGAQTATLAGLRQAYLDPTGALSRQFSPGEMTQSLCSPWTHDFRDCGCFYWASNHPDIAKIQTPPGAPPAFEADRLVAWQRSVKGSAGSPPEPARPDQGSIEMGHYEINNRWQELAIVLDGQEQGGTFAPGAISVAPLPDIPTLVAHLRYAAGVELGVMLEYLSAAFSLRRDRTGDLGDDIRAARTEIMRVAISEMRHLRAVNDILRGLSEKSLTGPYAPALHVASELPAGGGTFRPLAMLPLTRATQARFVDIERPSLSVDGLYGRIFATLQRDAPAALSESAALIIAEGKDHFETFSFVEDWLKPHAEAGYLIAAQQPAPNNQAHQALQTRYFNLLDTLHGAYSAGLPAGAQGIAKARSDMLANTGILGALDALAAASLHVTFDTINDPRFSPIGRP